MTMTDPIADMLTRIRNANIAKLMSVSMPSSKFKVEIAKILKQEGYISDFEVKNNKVGKTLTVIMKYSNLNERAIEGLERVSSPGMRRYVGHQDLKRVLGGMGIAIVSTSSGLMTDGQARSKNIGGEIIANVW